MKEQDVKTPSGGECSGPCVRSTTHKQTAHSCVYLMADSSPVSTATSQRLPLEKHL